MKNLSEVALKARKNKAKVWITNSKGVKAMFDPRYFFTNKAPFYLAVFFPLSGRMEYWHKDTPVNVVDAPVLTN